MYIGVHRFVREDCEEYFRIVELICRSHRGRPHWGTMHTLGPEELREIYPRFNEFRSLRDALDPHATFGNRHTDSLFGRR